MAIQNVVPVVGIGASAGGVEALSEFFEGLPPRPGFAFVVATHLAPDRESQLPEIIARVTDLPVATASDRVSIEANRVYVLPPGAVMTVDADQLRVAHQEGERERKPIDVFFASLAEEVREHSVGIVLSGADHDGTLGLKAIKEAGGLTIAQGSGESPPRYPAMPESAIHAGYVDMVLPVREMGERLVRYFQSVPDAVPPDESETASRLHRTIAEIVSSQVGHDFSGYKRATFLRRVARRMGVLQIGEPREYIDHLRKTPDEVMALFRDLLIGVTDFFRDRDTFEALAQEAIPRILENKGPRDLVRVWVPGCATGEEAYSLAILILEAMKDGPRPKVQIFGTDIDGRALGVARAGSYPTTLLSGVSPERLARFFVPNGHRYTVTKQVRDLCMFSDHNLIRDPPFSRMDLVSCRNLLIYFDSRLQDQVIPVFHYALRPGGYLFLGLAENLSRHSDLFSPLDNKGRIFQRLDNIMAKIPPGALSGFMSPFNRERKPEQESTVTNLRNMVEARVLDRFAPAHVVVNAQGDVVHYSPRTGKYLEAAPGSPNRQLSSMTRKDLRLDVRAALQEAMVNRRPAVRDRVAVELDDRVQLVNVSAEPIMLPNGEPLYLVAFIDVGAALSKDEAASAVARLPGAGIDELERDLRDTRERLQTNIEEYETALEELKSSNEELVSVNEELQSTNEELESSKEELQSVNEELHTVNVELHETIEELARSNGDLRNLLESTHIAIIFLDPKLVIRSFTPDVVPLFKLIDSDRGRPLTDIASTLEYPELLDDINAVQSRRTPVERHVSRSDETAHYLCRIFPYWGSHRAMEGVLITFVDVTPTVQAEKQQRVLVEELNHRVKNMLAVVLAITRLSRKGAPSVEAFSKSLSDRIHALSVSYNMISDAQWGEVWLRDLVQREFAAFADAGRLAGEGPAARLMPKATLALGLVFHELGTNAAKYGALSDPAGRLSIGWGQAGTAARPVLRILWQESGGPRVAVPTRLGFGSELVRREVEHELKGKVDFDYNPDGVIVTIDIPIGEGPVRLDDDPDAGGRLGDLTRNPRKPARP